MGDEWGQCLAHLNEQYGSLLDSQWYRPQTIGPSSWPSPYVALSPTPIGQLGRQSNLVWLDKRIDEVRVKL